MGDDPQVHLRQRRGIGTCALQERDLIIAGPLYGADYFVDLREGCHVGGEDDQLPLLGDIADKGEIDDLEGGRV